MHILRIASCKIALSETEVIHGIQQVCLAYAVFAADPNDSLSELKRRLPVVFKLKKRYVI
jgi:hypothetical protein